MLEAAYNDPLGVTRAFIVNELARINREFGANFDLWAFGLRSAYNESAGRVEVYLESLREQSIELRELNMAVQFAAGERIHMENAYKFDLEGLRELGAQSGFAAGAPPVVALANAVPELPPDTKRWERLAAHAGHVGLYVLMFVLAATGWAVAVTARTPLKADLFGFSFVPGITIGAKYSRPARGDARGSGLCHRGAGAGAHRRRIAPPLHQAERRSSTNGALILGRRAGTASVIPPLGN